MKIGIEAQRIFRKSKHGMDVVALELIRSIQALDTTNEYLLFAKKGADINCITDTPNFHTALVKGISYADWEQLSLPAALKKAKPDFVHCTANTAPLFCPVPLVVTVHDIIYLEETSFEGSAYQNFGNIYRKLIVPQVIKKAKKIITVSEFEKNNIVNHCSLDPEKISVVPNAVDVRFNTSFSKEQTAAFKQAHHLPEQFILFLGNTAPKKNTANVIKAYVHYCDNEKDPLPLVITDYQRTDVEKMLIGMNRGKYISKCIFPGYVANNKMPLLYNCAMLFLYPSLRESFGLPILEAMASGVPVITSNTSAIPEVAGDAAMLIDPEKPEELSQAISMILSNPTISTDYKQKGLARASQFSWEQSARKLLELYRRISS